MIQKKLEYIEHNTTPTECNNLARVQQLRESLHLGLHSRIVHNVHVLIRVGGAVVELGVAVVGVVDPYGPVVLVLDPLSVPACCACVCAYVCVCIVHAYGCLCVCMCACVHV